MLLFVVLLKVKKLLSVVVEVDHSLWPSSDGEMVVFAHIRFLCSGVANLCFAARQKHKYLVDGIRLKMRALSMKSEPIFFNIQLRWNRSDVTSTCQLAVAGFLCTLSVSYSHAEWALYIYHTKVEDPLIATVWIARPMGKALLFHLFPCLF